MLLSSRLLDIEYNEAEKRLKYAIGFMEAFGAYDQPLNKYFRDHKHFFTIFIFKFTSYLSLMFSKNKLNL